MHVFVFFQYDNYIIKKEWPVFVFAIMSLKKFNRIEKKTMIDDPITAASM